MADGLNLMDIRDSYDGQAYNDIRNKVKKAQAAYQASRGLNSKLTMEQVLELKIRLVELKILKNKYKLECLKDLKSKHDIVCVNCKKPC